MSREMFNEWKRREKRRQKLQKDEDEKVKHETYNELEREFSKTWSGVSGRKFFGGWGPGKLKTSRRLQDV